MKRPDILDSLKNKFPEITVSSNNQLPASCDVVFIAIHPPAIIPVLDEIKPVLRQDAVIISLAPKISMSKISENIGSFSRIVRMIPNACSIINRGYNSLAFSPSLDELEKKDLLKILAVLGDCSEVDEAKLEAYAVVAAMGPTYLWFQLYELERIGTTFGLNNPGHNTCFLFFLLFFPERNKQKQPTTGKNKETCIVSLFLSFCLLDTLYNLLECNTIGENEKSYFCKSSRKDGFGTGKSNQRKRKIKE